MITLSGRTLIRQTGGNTRYIQEVASGLADRGISITVVSPQRRTARDWAVFEALRMQESAKRRGSRVAWFPVDTGPVRRHRGIVTALTLQGVAALHEPSVRSPVTGRIWLERTAAAARASDLIITGSHSSADDIVTLVGPSVSQRLVVIPHGIADDWFVPAPEGTLDELGGHVDLGRPFAFYFGNIEPRKNLSLALSALELVREEIPDLQFIVSGAPAWESEDAMSRIRSTSWAHHVGRRTDEEVRALLAASRFFVFPSRYEGFGFPVLEAMAAGTPVACSRRGSLAEVTGDVAFTAEDLTPEAFAEACMRAARADRATVGAAGVKHARQFAWSSSIERHLDVLTNAR